MEVSGSGKDAGGDQQGIAGKKKSHEETRLDEDDHAYQQRAAPLNQALDVEQEVNKMLERSNHE